MAAPIALAAIGVYAARVVAAIIGVVTVAVRREERDRTLTSAPVGYLTWAGHWLNGAYVRTLRRAAAAGNRSRLACTPPRR